MDCKQAFVLYMYSYIKMTIYKVISKATVAFLNGVVDVSFVCSPGYNRTDLDSLTPSKTHGVVINLTTLRRNE